MKRFSFFDLFFVSILLAGLYYLIYHQLVSANKSLVLTVEEKRYFLNLKSKKLIDLSREYGKNMVVEIDSGRARIKESDCKDKICISFGFISKCGESAICVPNRVSIHIECDENEYDAVSR
ncbi:MAG: NusG domain II-containing protein [Calditerrivibrio sp.]|nr:NusG domain II-containing protein [Calditerrivibrio sp.]MCA1933121.1 NusG domain II-containing protein [Calditerrivibrio sp.]MCA1980035.1 NusG domain II-containing protein [Calditerrivibrio sp.]